MLAPTTTLPTGALGERFRRYGMELGAIDPPPGTERVERTISVQLRTDSMNTATLKGRGFDRRKLELQGMFMRELHGLAFLLPRPIPSVGADSASKAPVWIHACARFPNHARRDDENFRTLVSKSLGDALVGPIWQGQPKKGEPRRPAHRKLMFRGRVYEGGWLDDDTRYDWLFDYQIDEQTGPARITVTLIWDQPTGG